MSLMLPSAAWMARRRSADSEIENLPSYRANQAPFEPASLRSPYASTHTLGWNEPLSGLRPEPAHHAFDTEGVQSNPVAHPPPLPSSSAAAPVTSTAVPSDPANTCNPMTIRVVVSICTCIAFAALVLDICAASMSLHNGFELFSASKQSRYAWAAQLWKGAIYAFTFFAWPLYKYQRDSTMELYSYASFCATAALTINICMNHASEPSWIAALDVVILAACTIHLIGMAHIASNSMKAS